MEVSLAAEQLGLGSNADVHATLQQLLSGQSQLQQQFEALQQGQQKLQQAVQNMQQEMQALQQVQQSLQAQIANVTIRKRNRQNSKLREEPPIRLQREVAVPNGGDIGQLPDYFPASFLELYGMTDLHLDQMEAFYSTTFPGEDVFERRMVFSDFIQ